MLFDVLILNSNMKFDQKREDVERERERERENLVENKLQSLKQKKK